MSPRVMSPRMIRVSLFRRVVSDCGVTRCAGKAHRQTLRFPRHGHTEEERSSSWLHHIRPSSAAAECTTPCRTEGSARVGHIYAVVVVRGCDPGGAREESTCRSGSRRTFSRLAATRAQGTASPSCPPPLGPHPHRRRRLAGIGRRPRPSPSLYLHLAARRKRTQSPTAATAR